MELLLSNEAWSIHSRISGHQLSLLLIPPFHQCHAKFAQAQILKLNHNYRLMIFKEIHHVL